MKNVLTGVKMRVPESTFIYEHTPNLNLIGEMPSHVVLATTTMYKPNKDGQWDSEIKMRADLASRMFSFAKILGYDVVCVDGNSDSGWQKAVKDLGVILIPENLNGFPGKHPMGRSRRQAFDAAANLRKHEMIAWLEPEKHPYVLASNREIPVAMTATPVYEGKADLVLPRRIDTSFYPATQQAIEFMCNVVSMNMFRKHFEGDNSEDVYPITSYLDHCSGPRTFRKDLVDYFLDYSGEINGIAHDRWESVLVPVWKMMVGKKRVRGVAVPYEHPKEQTSMEGANLSYDLKRVEQTGEVISTLGEFLKADMQAAG